MKYKNRTLRVQSILYNNNQKDIVSSLNSIIHASHLLKKSNLIDQVEVAYGDCSISSIFNKAFLEQYIKENNQGVDKIDYLFFDKNLGTAKGHNTLMQNTDSEYLLIMNPDVILAPNTFIELLSGFSTNEIGIVEARQIPLEHPKDYDPVTGETSWASTACLLTKTKIAHAINGFDHESFFLYCDDVDFSWRVKLAGFKVIFKHTAIAFHDKRLNENAILVPSSAEEYYSAEAALMLAHKYSRPDLLKKIIFNFKHHGNDYHKKALEEYETRLMEGKLPQPIDPEHKYAQFIAGNYARHRF